jgi:hypothetical protein
VNHFGSCGNKHESQTSVPQQQNQVKKNFPKLIDMHRGDSARKPHQVITCDALILNIESFAARQRVRRKIPNFSKSSKFCPFAKIFFFNGHKFRETEFFFLICYSSACRAYFQLSTPLKAHLPSNTVTGNAAALAPFVAGKLGGPVGLSHRRLRSGRVQRGGQSRRTVVYLFTLIASGATVSSATFRSGRSGPYVPRYGL